MEELPHLSINIWLEKLELTLYASLFKKYKGVEEILWMSERDLKNLGVKNGSHRARISTSLSILKGKYEKVSKATCNFLRPEETRTRHERAKSNNSMSPVGHLHSEDSQSGVRSWPSTKPSTTFGSQHSSPQSNVENYMGTEATAAELKKALEKELSLDHSDLRSYAWYHGTILRQRAEEIVVQDGDFIVRDCISQPGNFVLTCYWNGAPLHFIVKKIIRQPDTVYEKIQYCFEEETFDSIADFITYYVGSKCPISESSGVIVSRPINRTMPLSYYSSRYGIQCQIHYVAKALENVPPSPEHRERDSFQIHSDSPRLSVVNKHENSATGETANLESKGKAHPGNLVRNLKRVGSDPTLSPSTERRRLEHRPNSGIFNSDLLTPESSNLADKPPPKPSRVPSKRCAQRPFVAKKERRTSDVDSDENSVSVPIPTVSLAHPSFKRQSSETRFSFLDRPSVSSSCSTPDSELSPSCFTLPKMTNESVFEPQSLSTPLLSPENAPLEGAVLSKLRQILLCSPPKHTAYHLTKMDLEVTRHYKEVDLGLGVNSGLELLLLPQGEQMQKDLIERAECMKLFVAVLILTCPEEEERVKIINRWIEIAHGSLRTVQV